MNKLKLNKEIISNLDSVKGGKVARKGFWTTGCSDGCSLLQTILRCSKDNCTVDCGNSWKCDGSYHTISRCHLTDGDYSCQDCK